MLLKFGKWGVKMFYNQMTNKKVWPPKDWPPLDQYRSCLDVDVMGDGDSTHQIDIYYADPSVRKNRVVIDIHGGAYIANTRKCNYGFGSVFLEKGYDVVLADYPLNEGTQDIIEQIRVLSIQLAFLHEKGPEYDLNPEAFFLTGDSAGGHFALLLAEMIDNPSITEKMNTWYGRKGDIGCGDFSCRAVAINCPVYDFSAAIDSSPLNKKGKTALFGPAWKDPEYVRLLSPRTHIADLKTPLLLSSCQNDFLRVHSETLEKDLKELGKPPVYVFIGSLKEEVTHVHNVNDISLQESVYVNDKMIEFFDRN